MALPRQNRLKHRQDFTAVYKCGMRRTAPHLVLRALPWQPQDSRPVTSQDILIGIVVSQKVSKRAVDRNRIRRQLRAACRQLLTRLSPGWLIVLVARPGAFECDYQQFLRELKQLLVDAEILNGN